MWWNNWYISNISSMFRLSKYNYINSTWKLRKKQSSSSLYINITDKTLAFGSGCFISSIKGVFYGITWLLMIIEYNLYKEKEKYPPPSLPFFTYVILIHNKGINQKIKY
jgi:hypothetical protein